LILARAAGVQLAKAVDLAPELRWRDAVVLDLDKLSGETSSWREELCFDVTHAFPEHGGKSLHRHPFGDVR
jgi:hypothetical protein